MRTTFIAFALSLTAMTASPAVAADYANTPGSPISFFGQPDTTTYGQVFDAPGGSLKSWSFFNSTSRPDGASFVVANWDGSKAVGPALFTSAAGTVALSDGFFSHTYSGINLALSAGTSYIAYLTVAGVTTPVSNVVFSGASDSPLGGGFRYLNSNGIDPLTLSQNWNSFSPSNIQFAASFADSIATAAPEPATWAMMLLGFGAVGFALRRNRKVTARVACS